MVDIAALEAAGSIAGMILTTEVLVVERDIENKEEIE